MNSGSSIGSLVGAVVGGIVGSLVPVIGTFAGIALGSALGGLAGGVYDYATQKPIRNEQENIADLFIQTSALGTPITQIFGHGRVAGNVFYLGERFVVEHEDEVEGGKGGGSAPVNVTKTYEIDLAIALCDTKISGPMAGIRRIWADGTLLYNMNDSRFDELPDGMTFYPGTAVQTPSAMIEAVKGVGNVPGYPFLCYVTLNNYDMGPYPRVPNFTFELYQQASPASALHQLARRASTGEIFAAAPGVNQVIVYDGTTQEQTHTIDVSTLEVGNPSNTSLPYATNRGFPLGWENTNTALWIAHPRDYQVKRIDASTKAVTHVVSVPYSLVSGGLYADGDMWFCAWHYTTKVGYLLRIDTSGIVVTITGGEAWDGYMKATVGADGDLWTTDNRYPHASQNSRVLRISPASNTVTQSISLGAALTRQPIDIATGADGDIWVLVAQADNLRRISPASNTITATITLSATPLQLAVASDGYIWAATTFNGGTIYRVNPATNTATAFESLDLSHHSPAHPILTPGPSGSMWVLSIPTWTTQRFATDGTVTLVSTDGEPRSQVAESTTHVWTNTTRGAVQRIADAGTRVQPSGSSIPRLKGVVLAVCAEVGLQAGDLDMTRIDNPHVAFKLVNVQTARSVVEMLMQGYLFFAIESNLQLKFLPREPGTVEATITEEELDAYDAGNDEEPPQQRGLLIGPRLTDEELPTEVRFSYVARQRNYQEDTKVASVSSSRAAGRNSRAVSLALVLEPTQAQRVAQETLDQLWMQRFPYRFTVNRDYAHLEPGDRVLVTSRGIQHSIILTEISYRRPGLVECAGRGDTTGVINVLPRFAGSGARSQHQPTETHTIGQLLNLPALNSADQDPRYHIAYQYAPTFWRGATLHRSVDGGSAYSEVHAAWQVRSTVGTVATALADAPSVFVFDETSTFTVVLTSGTALASVSDDELHAGANMAFIGTEMVQFGTATLIAPLTYTCSHLLRGRRGTEWASTGHASDERFVLLNRAVHAIPMTASERGALRHYKIVTSGVDISTVTAATFSATSENLTPWTVADPEAVRSSNDWILTWYARSTFAGEWSDGEPFGYDATFLHFRVRIYTDNTYADIARTLNVEPALNAEDVQTVTYTSAQQVSDFGGNQSTIYYRIFQISSYGAGRAADLVGV